jgi:hypothetical protein
MPRYQVFGDGGEVTGFVEVPASPPASSPSAQLLYHPLYANLGAAVELLPADTQRLCFVGFADRDYVAGETFEYNWSLPLGGEAVDVVYASVGLCVQVNPFSFDPADPVAVVVVAARDESARIAIPVVAPDGVAYTSVLEVSPIPSPQSIAQGDPLWIVWAVNTTTTQPTFHCNATDNTTPLNAEALNAGWDPLNEIGAPATTFTPTFEPPLRGLLKPPIP